MNNDDSWCTIKTRHFIILALNDTEENECLLGNMDEWENMYNVQYIIDILNVYLHIYLSSWYSCGKVSAGDVK